MQHTFQMKCPVCRKAVEKDHPEFPFCSDRCRLIDLGNWSSEKYVISTPIRPSDTPQNGSDQDGK
jgi:uncharacterized protein